MSRLGKRPPGYSAITEESVNTAKKALSTFRAMQPVLTAYARNLTGRPDVQIKISKTGGSTDGRTIHYRPPLALGKSRLHQKWLCDRRGEDSLMLCAACRSHEEVLVTIYHEIAHIWFDSFAKVSDDTKREGIQASLECKYSDNDFGRGIRERCETLGSHVRSYVELSNLISPWLGALLNVAEDARIENALFRALPGTKVMFQADVSKIFNAGLTPHDIASGSTGETVLWKDRKLNQQVLVAIYCKAAGYHYQDWFNEWVVKTLEDPELDVLIEQLRKATKVDGVFVAAFPILALLREKWGYFKSDTDPEEKDSDESDDADPDKGDSDESDAADPGPGPDESAESDPGMPDSDESAESDPGSDDSDESAEDSGTPSGAEGDSGEEEGGDPSSDPSGDGGSGGSNPEGSDDLDGEDSDREGDADSEGTEEGDEVDGSSDGGDSCDGGSGGHSPDSSDPVEGSGDDDEGAGDSEAGSGRSDEGSGDLPEDLPTEDDAGSLADSESEDSDSAGDGDGSDGGLDGVPSETAWKPEHDGSGDDSVDADESGAGGSSRETEDPVESDEELIDPGPWDDTPSGRIDTPPKPSTIDWGDATNIEVIVAEATGHDPDDGTPDSADREDESIAETTAMALVIVQGEWFDTPAYGVSGVKMFKEGEIGFAGGYVPHSKSAVKVGARGAFAPPESLIGMAVMEGRIAFTANERGKHERGLKRGRVHANSLGRRAPFNDPRVFERKTLPGRKSYFVGIGIDISGSTAGFNIDLAKRVAFAEADMLDRLGIPFFMYAHTGEPDNGFWQVTLHELKSPDQPWNDRTRHLLSGLSPGYANLDGHTMEQYRKMLDAQRATVKVLHYYTDGAMPCENREEELAVLRREIRTCVKRGYEVVGVGIRSDAPKEHGLETVEVNAVEDIKKVIADLRNRFTRR
jgi:hypothetical protein